MFKSRWVCSPYSVSLCPESMHSHLNMITVDYVIEAADHLPVYLGSSERVEIAKQPLAAGHPRTHMFFIEQ